MVIIEQRLHGRPLDNGKDFVIIYSLIRELHELVHSHILWPVLLGDLRGPARDCVANHQAGATVNVTGNLGGCFPTHLKAKNCRSLLLLDQDSVVGDGRTTLCVHVLKTLVQLLTPQQT